MNTPLTAYSVGVGQSESATRNTSEQMRAANLLFRIENVPFCQWHTKARIIMGSATLFDAFDALSLAFVLPVLVGLWHLSPGQIGVLIAVRLSRASRRRVGVRLACRARRSRA